MQDSLYQNLMTLKLILESAKTASLMAYTSQNRRDYESAGKYRSSIHRLFGEMNEKIGYVIRDAGQYGSSNNYLAILKGIQLETSRLYDMDNRLNPQDATLLIEKMYSDLNKIKVGDRKGQKMALPAIIIVSSVSLALLAASSVSPTARVVDPSSLTYPFGLAFLAIFLISLFFLKKGK
ncbi:MAG: hypothetical protein J4428_00600 [Candidatus Aenigmarchaeota archaeon]|nr:hypothetical protein [Candidatus Aenigmarchaeota archaeon]